MRRGTDDAVKRGPGEEEGGSLGFMGEGDEGEDVGGKGPAEGCRDGRRGSQADVCVSLLVLHRGEKILQNKLKIKILLFDKLCFFYLSVIFFGLQYQLILKPTSHLHDTDDTNFYQFLCNVE